MFLEDYMQEDDQPGIPPMGHYRDFNKEYIAILTALCSFSWNDICSAWVKCIVQYGQEKWFEGEDKCKISFQDMFSQRRWLQAPQSWHAIQSSKTTLRQMKRWASALLTIFNARKCTKSIKAELKWLNPKTLQNAIGGKMNFFKEGEKQVGRFIDCIIEKLTSALSYPPTMRFSDNKVASLTLCENLTRSHMTKLIGCRWPQLPPISF